MTATKLRRLASANPTCSAMLLHSDLCDLADAIERFDAEMRKKLAEYWEDPSNVTVDVQDELKQLRARLTACESRTVTNEMITRLAYHLPFGCAGREQMRKGLEAALATRASVPKDAATGD